MNGAYTHSVGEVDSAACMVGLFALKSFNRQ